MSDSHLRSRSACRHRRGRGFTLIELMIVVVISGILAALGIASFREHVLTAKNAEALAAIRELSVAEEKYRALNQVYLNITANPADLTNPTYYPTDSPDGTRYKFYGHPNEGLWRRLSPKMAALTAYGYTIAAGIPGDAWPTLGITATVDWPTTNPANYNEPWYVIQAIGDNNANGVLNTIVATSFNDVVFQEGIRE